MPSLHEKAISSCKWLEYRRECMRLAGMPDPIPPEVAGTDFYTVESFRGQRLDWLINQHVSDYILEQPEEICPFSGGYILSNDSGTLLNPQCCGDLSDVMWWKHLCYSKESVYYKGHPCPVLTFANGFITFTCQEDLEPFDLLTKPRFSVEQSALISAYERMLPVLLSFKQRISQALDQLDLPGALEFDLPCVLTVNNVELNEQDPIG